MFHEREKNSKNSRAATLPRMQREFYSITAINSWLYKEVHKYEMMLLISYCLVQVCDRNLHEFSQYSSLSAPNGIPISRKRLLVQDSLRAAKCQPNDAAKTQRRRYGGAQPHMCRHLSAESVHIVAGIPTHSAPSGPSVK